jgi:hypothetical protein
MLNQENDGHGRDFPSSTIAQIEKWRSNLHCNQIASPSNLRNSFVYWFICPDDHLSMIFQQYPSLNPSNIHCLHLLAVASAKVFETDAT